MNKYGVDNFEIFELKRIQYQDKKILIQKLNELEMYYIDYYNTLIPNGYNITKGGDSTSVRKCKSVTSYFYNGEIDLVFDSAMEASKHYSKNNLSNSSGIIRCCNGKANCCYGRIWRYSEDRFDKFPIKITKKQLENGYKQPVDKYTLNRIFVKSYPTIFDAINDDKNVKNSGPIKLCCDGKYNQAYGFIWRYRGDPVDLFLWKENQQYTPVDTYDRNGILINTFKSIEDAKRYYGIKSNAHILACCKGTRISCYNLIFRFKGDNFNKYRTTRKQRKDVVQFNHYDLNNNFIETITSTKLLPCSKSLIIDCCNGRRTHIGNSKWFYADDISNPDKNKIIGTPKDYLTSNNINAVFDKYNHSICTYNRYGELLYIHLNAKEVSKFLKIPTQTIYNICDGKTAYNKNYVFRYSGESFDKYYTFDYTRKHINIYDTENHFIKQCFNIKECISFLKLHTNKGSSIQKCLIHERRYAYGYQFFRADDLLQPDKTKIIAN